MPMEDPSTLAVRRSVPQHRAPMNTPTVAGEMASSPERVRDYAEAWLSKRKSHGVVMVEDERTNLETHVLPEIGHLAMCDVRSSHVRSVTHMRYVMQTAAMRAIPVEALPSLPSHPSGIVTARDDSTSKPARAARKVAKPLHARRDSNPRPAASKAAALSS